MLTHISLKQFAIVDTLELELTYGMTALTGETGAGKSILIDALALALGGRGTSHSVRHGAQRADITACFNTQNIPEARAWLQEQALDDDDEVILRRVLSADGRSKHFINGQLCPQNQVRALGAMLVNIHGQHEHQNLLKPTHQRRLLDRFAHHDDLLQELDSLYQAWHACQQQLTALAHAPEQQQAQLDLLQYQVNELEALTLVDGEIGQLEHDHKQLAHAEQLAECINTALTMLTESHDGNAQDALALALQQIQAAAQVDASLQNGVELLQTAQIHIQEAVDDINHHRDRIEINPEQLFQIEQRLTNLHQVARKHQVEPEQLPEVLNTLSEQLSQLQHADEHKAQLAARLQQLETQYQQLAKKLSDSRQRAATALSEQVTASMQTLGMQGGQFNVELLPTDAPSQWGNEKVTFQVTANPGQPLQALHQVASGGEMSRISLALQMITAKQDDTPTLIFDEVDVGIGGATAEIVGQLLQQLGQKAQVLCITHLAQVAAQANQQLQVRKTHEANNTSTTITPLNDEQRVQEIARMLGGTTITEQTLAHAKEMLLAPS